MGLGSGMIGDSGSDLGVRVRVRARARARAVGVRRLRCQRDPKIPSGFGVERGVGVEVGGGVGTYRGASGWWG